MMMVFGRAMTFALKLPHSNKISASPRDVSDVLVHFYFSAPLLPIGRNNDLIVFRPRLSSAPINKANGLRDRRIEVTHNIPHLDSSCYGRKVVCQRCHLFSPVQDTGDQMPIAKLSGVRGVGSSGQVRQLG